MHRPQKAAQMTTPCMLQSPTYKLENGGRVKVYKDAPAPFLANFSTYGSTEHESNGAVVVEENTTITTWYNPAIVAGCRVKRLTDGALFDIIGEPENVEMRGMFSIVKVRRVRGGA